MADRLATGYEISHPACGDEVVITGLSGYFPESGSVAELQESLFNKVNLVTPGHPWSSINLEIPAEFGKINKLDKFDASFFRSDYNHTHFLGSMSRLLLERCYEAILDAGMNPAEFRNTKTGVFTGCCYYECEKHLFYENLDRNQNAVVGCSHSSMSCLIAKWLGVTGPTQAVDTACSSAANALDHAFNSIRSGACDAAIVCGVNMCRSVYTMSLFSKMGMLSPQGKCKCFDESANGYVRSDTNVTVLLQKSKDSRRAYAQIVYSKSNCDGFKSNGIMYPSGIMQGCLLKAFYEECHIPANTVEYVEAHGTGTVAGDPEELNAIDDVMCKDRIGPLLIGSVKSNMGHSEGAAGLCAVVKLCIAYHSGYIPPNLHYNEPRKAIPALSEGRLKVVTEKQAWNRGLACFSGYGFGGSNVHILLRNFNKQKVNNGLPKDTLPRLVCVSGRTKPAVELILNSLEQKSIDIEEIRLWHAIHENNIDGHKFRGFVVLESTPAGTVSLARNVTSYQNEDRPICVIYASACSQLINIKELMNIPESASALHKCAKTLKDKNLDLIDIFTGNVSIYTNTLYLHIYTVALQIALTDIIRRVDVEPDAFLGYGIGELSCAYANGVFTAEETINLAYQQGLVGMERSDIKKNKYKQSSLTASDITPLIPANAIIIQVTPDYRFKRSLKCNFTNLVEVDLIEENTKNAERDLFTGLGKLYEAGLNLKIARLYPNVSFPVSQGTSMLSHLVTWDHRENWYVDDFLPRKTFTTVERTVSISMDNTDLEYLNGHYIGGRHLYPATGYLVLVWKTFAIMYDRDYRSFSIVFENIRFLRATTIPKKGELLFYITIHPMSGEFEVVENMSTVVTGVIYPKGSNCKTLEQSPSREHYNDPETVKMSHRDFYKELKLRGYDHNGAFKGVLDCTMDGSYGRVTWNDNWIVYIDCVLQVLSLTQDNRNLLVPTVCAKLSIDTDLHYKTLAKTKDVSSVNYLDVFFDKDTEVVRSAGLKIKSFRAAMDSKRTDLEVPIIEKHIFFPNFGIDPVIFEDVIRVYVDIIIENTQAYKFEAIEIIDNEYKKKNNRLVLEYVDNVLELNPKIAPELIILTDEENINNNNVSLEIPVHITKVSKLRKQKSAVLFVGANLSHKQQILKENDLYLREGGFILSREDDITYLEKINDEYDIVAMHNSDDEVLVLFKKKIVVEKKIFIKIETFDESFLWIEKLKEAIDNQNKVVLYAYDDISGIIGLVNCLRKEPGSDMIQCLLITDPDKPSFDPEFQFYKKQLDKNLIFNIYKDGQWGTYRHIVMKNNNLIISAPHALLSIETIGDLSTLKWVEGGLKNIQYKDENLSLIHVYRSALNFRDIVLATGRVVTDTMNVDRLTQEQMQGLELSGKLSNGARVFGVAKQTMSNLVLCDKNLMIPIPDEWTFEEAASITVAYLTVFTAFDVFGKMKHGESILIHAGAGAVGQAAINVALHRGCEVFTTVGLSEKKAFLKKIYPQLKDNHIGHSRDVSFEQMIMKQTDGKGVDLVLNCLSEDKLLASIRCLGRKGRFLEIGKYDIVQNTPIVMSFQKQEISFHSIMLDYIFEDTVAAGKLLDHLIKGIIRGEVRPLIHCVFKQQEVEAAYRYMASSKHIGKVIIKIREEEDDSFVKPKPMLIDAQRRYICCKDYVYIIVGGLGGFGLELADWLVLRGARKLVLISTKGIRTGYQASRVKIWASYGVDICLLTHDVTTESGCRKILETATGMGHVEAIFNLALVLKDGLFQNQSSDSFKKTFKPKALATLYLDKLSRAMCPDLRDFVAFSTYSCGRGNSGQSNYGLANSVMERICEKRKKEGFPGLVIQWGAIADVGMFAEMQAETGLATIANVEGIVPQRISSCIRALDILLMQKHTITSIYVLAQKGVIDSVQISAVEAIARIIGVNNLKAVSYQSSLSELGMDSIMLLEVKQILERDYDIVLTAQEIRTISLAKIMKLAPGIEKLRSNIASNCGQVKAPDVDKFSVNLQYFIQNFGEKNNIYKPFIIMPSRSLTTIENVDHSSVKTLFMIPGLEGSASSLEPLCRRLHAKTCVLQLPFDNSTFDLQDMTDKLYKIMRPMKNDTCSFNLLGYSYGTMPLLELAAKLESEGLVGTVFCIDGSPIWLKSLFKNLLDSTDDFQLQENIIKSVFEAIVPNASLITDLIKQATEIVNYDDKVDYIMKHLPLDINYSNKLMKSIWKECANRLRIVKDYNINNIKKIKSPIVLFRPEYGVLQEFSENYELDKFTESDVKVHFLKGNHITVLDDPKCALIIEKYLDIYE